MAGKARGGSKGLKTPFTPMTPDNGITFLDNKHKLSNPRNEKTPPAPMWGEEESDCDRDSDEEFYTDQVSDKRIITPAHIKKFVDQQRASTSKASLKGIVGGTALRKLRDAKDPKREVL